MCNTICNNNKQQNIINDDEFPILRMNDDEVNYKLQNVQELFHVPRLLIFSQHASNTGTVEREAYNDA